KNALEILKKALGEQHPNTAAGYNSVALGLTRQGKIRAALPFWKSALLGHDIGRLDSAGSGFDRSLFLAKQISPRVELALGLARLNEGAEAWTYAEQSLARGLLDDLTGASTKANRGQVSRLRKLDERLGPLLVAAKLSRDQESLRDELTHQRRALLKKLSEDQAEQWATLV